MTPLKSVFVTRHGFLLQNDSIIYSDKVISDNGD